MKKRFSILIALVLVLAVALPVLASCVTTEKTVKSIAVVSPKTEYKVGDTIDYDNLQIEVTYEDNTTEKKTVRELKATVTQADLSKAGTTSYTITYSGKPTTVTVTVTADEPIVDIKNFQAATFVEPAFYTNYKTKSADRGNKEETRADFRVTGETYEVGNANKFVYRPYATGLDLEQQKVVTVPNVKTTAKVYSKDAKNGTYAEVTADALADFVTIDDNTYLFTQQAAGKYVKLEISLDAEEYDVEGLEEENRTITVEFVVVDGGYNVYDQMGLSAMCDIGMNSWADLWNCQSVWNADKQVYELSDKTGVTPLKLEADDKPLYAYVGNISWVILHTSIEINADLLPARYFWTSADQEGYTTAYNSLTGLPDMQAKLLGSLNDGMNNDYYHRILDMVPTVDENGTVTNLWPEWSDAVGLNLVPNMAKALFLTKQVSVSGNYNSITIPTEKSAGGRMLYTIADWDKGTKATDPAPHHSIFQMYRPNTDEGYDRQYTIKNLSMSGNMSKQDVSSENGIPGGMLMSLVYANHMTYSNIVADKFFTNIVVDGYGPTGVNIENSKFYDAYSNMSYMWRSKVNIANSELIGSGGPLFILCDGDNRFVNPEAIADDASGSNMTVDTLSVLKAPATGNESWYAIYDAQPIVGSLVSQLEPAMTNFGKTIVTDVKGDNNYINIIAVIICSPGKLFEGETDKDGNIMDVCGSFTTMDGETVVERFAMHNPTLTTLRASVGYNATYFPLILQIGGVTAYSKGDGALYTLGATGEQTMTPEQQYAWATSTNNKLAVYTSAGSGKAGSVAPYFGVVLEINQLQAAQ